jgi:hypothetical protein
MKVKFTNSPLLSQLPAGLARALRRCADPAGLRHVLAARSVYLQVVQQRLPAAEGRVALSSA